MDSDLLAHDSFFKDVLKRALGTFSNTKTDLVRRHMGVWEANMEGLYVRLLLILRCKLSPVVLLRKAIACLLSADVDGVSTAVRSVGRILTNGIEQAGGDIPAYFEGVTDIDMNLFDFNEVYRQFYDQYKKPIRCELWRSYGFERPLVPEQYIREGHNAAIHGFVVCRGFMNYFNGSREASILNDASKCCHVCGQLGTDTVEHMISQCPGDSLIPGNSGNFPEIRARIPANVNLLSFPIVPSPTDNLAVALEAISGILGHRHGRMLG